MTSIGNCVNGRSPFTNIITQSHVTQTHSLKLNIKLTHQTSTHHHDHLHHNTSNHHSASFNRPLESPLTSTSHRMTPLPIKLKNLINGEQTVDILHNKYKRFTANKSSLCDESRCLAAILNQQHNEHKLRDLSETLEQAKDFINQFYASIKRLDSPAHKNRLAELEEQLANSGRLYLKETELIFGAKLAWRNAARCIGRIQWSRLQVFDARFTTNAQEMFEALCNHIKYATNKGKLRSAITVFPERTKSIKNDWRIWNTQLIGYAGYKDPETGKVIGDPANVEVTQVAQRLGWKGKGTRFDVLPLVLTAAGAPPQVFPLPEDLVLRVKLKHPKFPWFADLGLEWYALPAVANMMLDVGGLQFTAAPFSGWYMVTEIGTRDLADVHRYNVLEEVALAMGLNTTSNATLWKDKALVELNIAVLDSFQSAGVTIVDHHTACETFMTHLQNEQRLRGGCPADWVWLVPPTSGSLTQVFHQEMVNYHLLPNYEYQEPIWKLYDWLAHDEALKAAQREKEAAAKELQTRRESAQLKQLPLGADDLSHGSPKSPLLGPGVQSADKVASLSPGSRLLAGMMAVGAVAPGELTPKRIRFKEIARAVKFTSKLFGKALSRRIKATILYATETGKSERYANKLAQTFSSAFNVHLMSMVDYDMTCLEHEALLLVVTSTFGNGDPPENGELFAKHLAAVKITGDTSPDIDSINSVSTNPFFQMMSEDHAGRESAIYNSQQEARQASLAKEKERSSGDANLEGAGDEGAVKADQTPDSGSIFEARLNRASSSMQATEDELPGLSSQDDVKHELQMHIRPLSNVRFGVFALGSTAYPHYCAFGRYVDQILGELGAERIQKCACGDELCGQEKAFNEWSTQIFKRACEVFCLTDYLGSHIEERPETVWNAKDVRFLPVDDAIIENASKHQVVLRNLTGKKIIRFSVKDRLQLHAYKPDENVQTFSMQLESINPQSSPQFKPGDHIAIYPTNKLETVDKIIKRMERDLNQQQQEGTSGKLNKAFHFDNVYSIVVKRENMDLTPASTVATHHTGSPATGGHLGPTSTDNQWIPHDRLPPTSVREALTRYLDVTSPPNQEFLLILSLQTNDPEERKRLQQLGRNFTAYEAWKNHTSPNLVSVLEEFPTIKLVPALITQIPSLKPRFYSVSGTSIALTVGVVRFKTASGELRDGLCSNYLLNVPIDKNVDIYGYIRSAPAFHMPLDKSTPMILISAGTGMAPFRSFWEQRLADMKQSEHSDQILSNNNIIPTKFGSIMMYFGCRNSQYILYKNELDDMHAIGVISRIGIAFSRQAGKKKMYVQDKLVEDGPEIYKLIMNEGAHVYVCGDVAMAQGVYKSLASIFNNLIKTNNHVINNQNKTIPLAIANRQSSNDMIPSAGSATDSGLGGDFSPRPEDGESILMNLRNLNRYHEDIFGAKQAS